MRKNVKSASKAKQVKAERGQSKKSKLVNKSSEQPMHNTTFNHESRTFKIKEEKPEVPITLNFDIDSESEDETNIIFDGIEEPGFLPQNSHQKLPFFIEEIEETHDKCINQAGSSFKANSTTLPPKKSPVFKTNARNEKTKTVKPVNKKSKEDPDFPVVKNARSLRVSPRTPQPRTTKNTTDIEKVEKKSVSKKLFDQAPAPVAAPVHVQFECIKKEFIPEDEEPKLVINEEEAAPYHLNQNPLPDWRNATQSENRISSMDTISPDDPHFACKKRIFQLEKALSQVKSGYESRIEYLKQELKQQLNLQKKPPKSNLAKKQKLLLNMKKKKF